MLFLRNMLFVILLTLIPCNLILAADAGGDTNAHRDTLNLKLFIMRNATTLEIDSDSLDEPIAYQPNVPNFYGINLSYAGFGMRLQKAAEYAVHDETVYGKTEATDYQIFYYGASLCMDLMYQRYKGFYLESPENFGYIAGDPPTIRGDLEMENLGFNLYYILSERLSLPAAFEQIGVQRVSGGSWILMMSLWRQEISADYSLIPGSVAPSVGMEYLGGRYINGTLGLGYGYSFICGNFFFSPLMIWNFGLTRAREDRASDSVIRYDIAYKIIGKFAIGYNGETYYWGMVAVVDLASYWIEQTDSDSVLSGSREQSGDRQPIDIAVALGYVEFFLGFRFAPD